MIPSLKDVYRPYFKIGAAVNHRSVKTHKDLLVQHFDSITCENEMKYSSVCGENGEYDYSNADLIYHFALENGIDMRGHTLVWHNQTPQFIFAEKDPTLLKERLKNHISNMAQRYDQNVYAWDVVNEAIEDKTDLVFRQTKWLEILGKEYIAEAFRMANDIFKGKTLYYNDYNELQPEKRDKIIQLLQNLINNGVPIHGAGLQFHVRPDSNPESALDMFKAGIEKYAKLGLKISITEMDISMFAFEDRSSLAAPSAKMTETQALYYEKCFKLFREYSKQIESVTLWGIADDENWLDNFPVPNRKDWPLLFDGNHEPKEAFWRVANI